MVTICTQIALRSTHVYTPMPVSYRPSFISFFYLHDKCPKIILMMSLSQSVSNKNANIEIPSRFPNTEAAIVQTLKCLNLIKQNSIELTCSWLYIKKKKTRGDSNVCTKTQRQRNGNVQKTLLPTIVREV